MYAYALLLRDHPVPLNDESEKNRTAGLLAADSSCFVGLPGLYPVALNDKGLIGHSCGGSSGLQRVIHCADSLFIPCGGTIHTSQCNLLSDGVSTQKLLYIVLILTFDLYIVGMLKFRLMWIYRISAVCARWSGADRRSARCYINDRLWVQ